MGLLRRLLSITTVTTLIVVGLVATPAAAATIQSGHVDFLDVDFIGGNLTLDIKTRSPANDDVDPADTVLRLLSSSALAVPTDPKWACVGPPGSTVFVAPESAILTPELIELAWNTEDVPATQGPVRLELVGATGPVAGARFTVWTNNFAGEPTFRFNTNPAPGCPIFVWPGNLAAGTHGHANWAFSHLGTYRLTFRAIARGGAGASSANLTYTFQVG